MLEVSEVIARAKKDGISWQRASRLILRESLLADIEQAKTLEELRVILRRVVSAMVM